MVLLKCLSAKYATEKKYEKLITFFLLKLTKKVYPFYYAKKIFSHKI